MSEKKGTTVKKTEDGQIDWKAMGYDAAEESGEYQSANSIKIEAGPSKFKVQAGKTYRVGFPFVKPVFNGDGKQTGMEVLFKPVEHLRYYDDAAGAGARFVMPKGNDKLRKRIIDTFGAKSVSTHYLTPIIVYDTNESGKLLSTDAVSYTMKVLAIPAGRYAKLKEASSNFSLADYDFLVTLDGDEKTEDFQKMNFKAQTKKDDITVKTAVWRKGKLVKLPDDEDEEAVKVTMAETIAEAYELAPNMVSVLGTRELKESKIKEILEEWEGASDEDDDENSDDVIDEDEDEGASDDEGGEDDVIDEEEGETEETEDE